MNGTDGSVRESAIDWRAFRIVPSRFPPVDAWDRIAASGDFAALAEIEGLTNPRIREALGVLANVPRDRWVIGPGTTPVMAAFTHLNPEGSRFSDGTYGVFYAARHVETAIRETSPPTNHPRPHAPMLPRQRGFRDGPRQDTLPPYPSNAPPLPSPRTALRWL